MYVCMYIYIKLQDVLSCIIDKFGCTKSKTCIYLFLKCAFRVGIHR